MQHKRSIKYHIIDECTFCQQFRRAESELASYMLCLEIMACNEPKAAAFAAFIEKKIIYVFSDQTQFQCHAYLNFLHYHKRIFEAALLVSMLKYNILKTNCYGKVTNYGQ
jgi:hypothetical protein